MAGNAQVLQVLLAMHVQFATFVSNKIGILIIIIERAVIPYKLTSALYT